MTKDPFRTACIGVNFAGPAMDAARRSRRCACSAKVDALPIPADDPVSD